MTDLDRIIGGLSNDELFEYYRLATHEKIENFKDSTGCRFSATPDDFLNEIKFRLRSVNKK